MLDDRRALTAEDIDIEASSGSEFTYDTGLVTEAHQVKRQNGNSNSWTVKALPILRSSRRLRSTWRRAGATTLSPLFRAGRYKSCPNALASRQI